MSRSAIYVRNLTSEELVAAQVLAQTVTATSAVVADNLTANGVDYALPLADGNPGEHLETDGAGTLSWGLGSATIDNLASMSTGVISGGTLSVGTPNTTFSISDGSGFIVDNSVTPPTYNLVTWTGLTNITDTEIGSGILTFVGINSAGTVVQQTGRWTNEEHRDLITLGVTVHVDLATIDTVNQEQNTALAPSNQVHDVITALGFINIEGNVMSKGTGLLEVQKTSGKMFGPGINFSTNPKDPHQLILQSKAPIAQFQYRLSDAGDDPVTGLPFPLTDTDIDPDRYEQPVGTYTAVPTNRWTVQRFYSFTSNNLKIQPGQHDYGTADDAIAGIATDVFVTEPSVATNGMLIGYLIVQEGTTDLSTATFRTAGKFAGSAVGSAGVGSADLQDVYDNTVAPKTMTIVDNDPLILSSTATISDSNCVEVVYDAAGFSGGKALDIIHTTGAQAANTEEDGILVSIDESAAVGGEVNALCVVATEGAASAYAVKAAAVVNPLFQLSGSFTDPSTGDIDNNGVSVAVGTLAGVPLWASNGDYVIVANSAKFEEIEFLFGTVAGASIQPTFEFSTGTGPLAWTSFTPSDATNGFQNNGVLVWQDADTPGWITDGGDYKIKITRNRASGAPADPEALNNGIKVAVVTEYGWNKDADVTCNTVDAASMTTDDIDTRTATTLLLGKSTATKVEIADTGIVTEVQGSLDVLGTSTLQGATTFGVSPNEFTLPATDGTANQILKTDGLGAVTWQADNDTTTAVALGTTGADVNVDLASPPTTGQVLKATSATTATWQAEGGGGGGSYVVTFGGSSQDVDDFMFPSGTMNSGDAGASLDVSNQMVLSKAGTLTSIGYTKNITGTTSTLKLYINGSLDSTHTMTSATNYGTITGLSRTISSGDRLAIQIGVANVGLCFATLEIAI
jgi:hypothetical protein